MTPTIEMAGWRRIPRILLGLCVLGAGTVLTLQNFHRFQNLDIRPHWPFLLILLGLAKLFEKGMARGFWGLVPVLVGTAVALQYFLIPGLSLTKLWPMFVVLVGAGILLGAVGRRPTSPKPL